MPEDVGHVADVRARYCPAVEQGPLSLLIGYRYPAKEEEED